MNWPPEIIRLYNQHSIPKRFRLHFPNGERPDILNENIEQESMTIHQRLCSKERLQFGMCEATTMECNVFDIEQKWIIDENGNRVRNPNPLRGNIKGCEVEVIQEIDISSCSSNFIAEYGKTAEDVPWPYFEVPFGRFVIESCQKTANMDTRKLTGYDALNSAMMEKSLKPWVEAALGGTEGTMSLDDMFSSILVYNGITPTDHVDGEYTWEELCAIKDTWGTSMIAGSISGLSAGLAEGYGVFGEWFGTTEEELFLRDSYCKIIYDTEQLNLLWEHLLKLGSKIESINELIGKVKNKVAIGSIKDPEMGLYSEFKIEASAQIGSILHAEYIKGLVATQGIVTICKWNPASVLDSPYGGSYDPIASYQIVKDIQLLWVAKDGENNILSNTGGVEISVDVANVKAITDDDFTVGNVLSGILEINGLFGVMTSEGLSVRRLGNPGWTLSRQWQLKSDWLLNESVKTMILDGSQEEAWYDEDFDVGLYGTVRILGEANKTLAKYTGAGGLATYNIENNALFRYFNFTESQMVEICRNLQSKICILKWSPATVTIMSRPYLEIGDEIAFGDDGKIVCSYIFDKITSGIVSMTDEIDSTMVKE